MTLTWKDCDFRGHGERRRGGETEHMEERGHEPQGLVGRRERDGGREEWGMKGEEKREGWKEGGWRWGH